MEGAFHVLIEFQDRLIEVWNQRGGGGGGGAITFPYSIDFISWSRWSR